MSDQTPTAEITPHAVSTSQASSVTPKSWSKALVTVLPVLGAVGTLFVWGMAYFYVGTVQLKFAQTYKALDVKVFNSSGEQCTMHESRFQLMPGQYFLQVIVDGEKPVTTTVKVEFNRETDQYIGGKAGTSPIAFPTRS